MPDSTGAISTEKVTYQGWAKFNDKSERIDYNAKGITNNTKSEEEKNKKMAESGWTEFNKNDVIKYNVSTEEGFHTLVASPEQRVYIINSGLNYLQNSKTNAAMASVNDDGTPEYNDTEIDLREAINEPPSKRSLTPQQKMERQLDALNLSEDEVATLLANLAARKLAAAKQAEETVNA